MRVLHYTIGFPPKRSGGLPLYAIDLMNEQVKQGHEVFALYPGRINIVKKLPYIKKAREKAVPNVIVYELVNSLPLPLFGGIKSPDHFMVKVDLKLYKDFLATLDVDIIHIHTLMGLHKEFFEISKKNGIKIIYTSHDYFGLSPVPDFYLDGKSWDEENTNEFWNRSAKKAMSTNRIRIFQLSFYPMIRKVIRKIKGTRESKKYISTKSIFENNTSTDTIDFSNLKKYYNSIFGLVDIFHFNSEVSMDVYLRNIPNLNEKNYEVISITNASISNVCKKRKTPYSVKRIAYIGPYQENKGFYDFLDFAKRNKNRGYNFLLFGGDKSYSVPSYIENKGRYLHSEIENIFPSIDLILIPSLWKETFGFLTLEALSYGTAVMVSKNVGSGMLIDTSMIFDDLKEVEIPNEIFPFPIFVKTMSEHAKEIVKLYGREIEN